MLVLDYFSQCEVLAEFLISAATDHSQTHCAPIEIDCLAFSVDRKKENTFRVLFGQCKPKFEDCFFLCLVWHDCEISLGLNFSFFFTLCGPLQMLQYSSILIG